MTTTSKTEEASAARSTAAGPEAALRGERWLRAGERLCLRVEAAVDRLVPPGLNPLTQTGAVANITLLVAVISGVLLLLWYTPSVHQAHASVEAMGRSPWTAGLMRSLHRYSSDACMAFVLLHAARLLVARRVTGARWVAWVTGLALLVLLWVVGWLGYWLVWDGRAQQVALGTARVLDALPIFADPLGRSFLTDGAVNSLLFFVVFFVHMLLPLGMGVALWLHITRLSRPRFLPDRRMTLWVVGALTVASLLHPATSAAPARMTVTPGAMTFDAWYLAGAVLTDRLGAGALWALLLGAGALALSAPWALTRARPAVAKVEPSKCNGCTLCSRDCPYDAITMVPHATRAPGVPFMAQVDPAKCVGCGICAGSCDSVGIGLAWLPEDLERRRVEAWLATTDGDTDVAFACAEAAQLQIDETSGRCAELPGYRVLRVPCAGWVHPLTVERALRRGAGKALIVACPDGSCRYREGTRWTRERLGGRRLPVLRTDKVDPARVRVVEVDRARPRALGREAAAFRAGAPAGGGAPTGVRAALGGLLVAATLVGGVVAVSEAPYAPPAPTAPELVVTFKHHGEVSEVSRRVSDAEKAATLPHMRRDVITERRRAPVRLRVSIDGAVVLERALPPSGLWGDGPSVAVERLTVAPGAHLIEVAIGDEHDEASWRHVAARTLELSAARRSVVRFDRTSGFTWE